MRLVIGLAPNMTVTMNDPELRVLIAACGAAFRQCSIQSEDRTFDWPRLLRLAQRHRVEALCWQGLGSFQSAAPSEIAQHFINRTNHIAETNLRAAAECARLHSIFDNAGIRHLFLKGLTLASLAYPQPFLKMSWDIDLLIDAGQLGEAANLLGEAGYRPIIPRSADINRVEKWHVANKESLWSTEKGNLKLDLHTRFADNRRMLHGMVAGSRSQMVSIATAISLPTLRREELFAYLCVHGASSAWFRLKWICDLAALLQRESEDEIMRLYEHSQRLGAGRAADQALLLADNLFGIAMPASLRSLLHGRPVSRWLASLAKAQLCNEIEPTDRRLGTASIHYSQPFLRSSLRFALSDIARQLGAIGSKA